jgi:6-phosphogluconolactonase
MDGRTGKLSDPVLVAEGKNPSFLVKHPSQPIIFSVNEIDDYAGGKTGAVSAFRIEEDGKLKLLNQQPSGGGGPTHLSIDPQGKNALVANYGTGSVAVLPVDGDGKLRPPSSVVQHDAHGGKVNRDGPHAHCINLDPSARFALTCDLGLDKVFVYRFHENGVLDNPMVADQPSGPRHLAFHPSGKYVYVINEISSTVTAFAFEASRGALKSLQTVTTLPADWHGENWTAEIIAHPSGKWVYGSNRGHNSIAVFSVDPETGKLTPAGHEPTQGKAPRNFNLDPTGHFLLAANQDSDTVVVFHVDQETGKLMPAAVTAHVPTPVCVLFVPPNR